MGQADRDDVADALASMAGGAVADQSAGATNEMSATEQATHINDDAVIAPRPDPSVFAPRRRADSGDADRPLERKRTLIPILLTLGFILPAIGSLKWFAGDESPFAAWETWATLVCIAAGAVLIALAAINMSHVRAAQRSGGTRGV